MILVITSIMTIFITGHKIMESIKDNKNYEGDDADDDTDYRDNIGD